MDLSNFAQIAPEAFFPEGADISERFQALVNQFHFVELSAINHGDEKYHVVHYRKLAEACYDPVDIHQTGTESESFYRLDTEAQCREFLGAVMAAWKFDPEV